MDQLPPAPYQLLRLARQEGCCDMSLDEYLRHSLSTFDGPAGTHYGPGAAGLLRRYTGRATSRTMGRATTSRTMGRTTSRADNCAIVPLDLRASDRRRRYIWRDIEAPRQPAAGVMSRRCMAEDRARQTAAKLHTAGPNIPDRDIRLDLLCPAAFGSGPVTSRSQESDADLSGVERVEGGGYGEPYRDGPGSTKMCRYGEWRHL